MRKAVKTMKDKMKSLRFVIAGNFTGIEIQPRKPQRWQR